MLAVLAVARVSPLKALRALVEVPVRSPPLTLATQERPMYDSQVLESLSAENRTPSKESVSRTVSTSLK